MVERVAAGIAKGDGYIGLMSMPKDRRELYFKRARAAIGAMRISDAVEGVPGGIAFEDAFFGSDSTIFHAMQDAWNASIDAFLAAGEPK